MNRETILEIIENGENQSVKFKQVWKDEYLKTICAFGNTEYGGDLFVQGYPIDPTKDPTKGYKRENCRYDVGEHLCHN